MAGRSMSERQRRKLSVNRGDGEAALGQIGQAEGDRLRHRRQRLRGGMVVAPEGEILEI